MEPCCARAAASSLTVLLPMLAVGGRCARRSLLAARVRAAADSRAVPRRPASAAAGDPEEERWRRLAATNCNNKYKGKFRTISDDVLSTSIRQSVEAVENVSDPEEERWLKYAALCGNKTASQALGNQALRGVRAWGAFQQDSQGEIYEARVESELLRKVKQVLAGQKEPRPSPKDVPCPRMAASLPRKASKSGAAPTSPAEEAYIREQEAAVRTKLRKQLEASAKTD
jgi:hypothetical protein